MLERIISSPSFVSLSFRIFVSNIYLVKGSICRGFFHYIFRDKGLDKGEALTEAAEATGIGRTSIFCFLKQKLSGSGLRDNKAEFLNRLTVYERLELEEVDHIRHLVHDEMAKMRKKKGESKDEEIEAEYPSYGNVQLVLHTVIENCQKKSNLTNFTLIFEWTKVL